MARKLDRDPAATAPAVRLPYRSEGLAAIIRLMSTFSSSSFQRRIVDARPVPDDPNAIPALFAVATGAAPSPSALATALRTSPATASRVIERLAQSGLVVRAANHDDRRSSVLTLTPHGSAVADELFAAGDRLMERLLTGWSTTDRERFTVLLARFAAAVEREASATSTD